MDMQEGDGIQQHKHGSLGGHVLPGSFFLMWATWWFANIVSIQIHRAQQRKEFTSRSYYQSTYISKLPLEPLAKLILPFIGILGELWLSHGKWRTLYDGEGQFIHGHLNNWQHSAMFGAVMVSGCVDLIGAAVQLPSGTEQAFLGLAFSVEGMLLAFHLKGTQLEVLVHLLLVTTTAACAFFVFLEVVFPNSVLISLARCWSVLLQGTWWCQTGRVLFLGNPAWRDDPENSMGATMFLPTLYVTHCVVIAVVMLIGYVCIAHWFARKPAAQRGFEMIERANAGKSGRVRLQELICAHKSDDMIPLKANV
eukprot:jgi/Ulvmu1/2872/UM146_0014.1